MIHFDFDSCPKMAVIAPTSDAANQLFCFLRSETDVEWAGSETMDDTLWFHFTEQTVYLFGSSEKGLQVGHTEIVKTTSRLEKFAAFTVEQFIEAYTNPDREEDNEIELLGLI